MKTFPITAVLGVVTGRAWGPFSEVHELAEHIMGHAIWTHEFASTALFDEMRRRVVAAHPGMADVTPDDCPTSELDLDAKVAAQVARFGRSIDVPRGSDNRTKSPMQTAVEKIGAGKVLGIQIPAAPGGENDGR